MDQARIEMAERIADLRRRSPFTQQNLADELGVQLRTYQRLEQVGTGSYSRCQELAEIHGSWTDRHDEWQHVNADWLWDGRTRPAQAEPSVID